MRNTYVAARRTVQRAINGFNDDELLTRAAALAFYSALSFAPLVVLILWVLAALRPEWQGQLGEGLTRLVGSAGAAAVQMVVSNARQTPRMGNLAGLLGLGVTLFSASAVFAQLQGTLNHIWGLRAKPEKAVSAWLRARARALGLVIGTSFLLIVSFAVSALIRALMPEGTTLWWTVENLISTLVFLLAFGAMYRVLPDATIAWSDAGWGAALTTVLFLIGKSVIGLYLGHVRIGGAYGPAGAIVILLTWVYYASAVVLLGAELTHGLSLARGHPVRPDPHAELLSPSSADQRDEKPDRDT